MRVDESPGELAVHVNANGATLGGTLGVPFPFGTPPSGVVLFAHGSGSSRFRPRNRFVAGVLREAHLATLLLDLLTEDEEVLDVRTSELRFDLDLLSDRLIHAINWLGHQEVTRELPIGIFGASTGGGAALMAAARLPDRVQAVVSRGGRADLAGEALAVVRAPTLLIVGGKDDVVISLNRQAMEHMRGVVRLEIVPGATHLFEERGALDAVATLARRWFTDYLAPPVRAPVR